MMINVTSAMHLPSASVFAPLRRDKSEKPGLLRAPGLTER